MAYQIRNWATHYETNETRKLVSLHWVKIPNQQDSLAYRLIAAHPKGPEIFTAWILMIQVSSREKRDDRGKLPFSPEELGIVTGFPAKIFALAIDFLKSPKIAWIEQSPDNLPASPDASGFPPENLPVERKKEEKEGKEGKKEQAAPLGPWFENPEFVAAWKAWEKERKQKGTDRNLAKLQRLSGNNISRAIAILNESADNGWTGLFELKGNSNGKNHSNRSDRLNEDARNLRSLLRGETCQDSRTAPENGLIGLATGT
jgi:hypothetical protein